LQGVQSSDPKQPNDEKNKNKKSHKDNLQGVPSGQKQPNDEKIKKQKRHNNKTKQTTPTMNNNWSTIRSKDEKRSENQNVQQQKKTDHNEILFKLQLRNIKKTNNYLTQKWTLEKGLTNTNFEESKWKNSGREDKK